MTDDKINDTGMKSDSKQFPDRGAPLPPAIVVRDHVATSYVIARLDPFFVTQLIATAVQMPQTRTLRRGSPEDAKMSYRSAADQNKPKPASRATGTSRVA